MSVAPHLRTRDTVRNRNYLSKIYVDDFVSPGRRRYGLWSSPDIDMSSYDRHVVKESELMRPDLIAYQYYNDVTLWWVICFVNGIENAFTDLEIGMVLKIPKEEAISRVFGQAVVA